MCIAASLDDTFKMQLYIEAGIPVTLGDYDGRTPLHLAAANHSETMCRLLLGNGANREAVDAFGNTPDLSWLPSLSNRRVVKDSFNLLCVPQID